MFPRMCFSPQETCASVPATLTRVARVRWQTRMWPNSRRERSSGFAAGTPARWSDTSIAGTTGRHRSCGWRGGSGMWRSKTCRKGPNRNRRQTRTTLCSICQNGLNERLRSPTGCFAGGSAATKDVRGRPDQVVTIAALVIEEIDPRRLRTPPIVELRAQLAATLVRALQPRP